VCLIVGLGRMIPDSPAEKSGQLFIGDHLLAVNNQDVSSMEHGDIVGLIKRSGLNIRLLVQQPHGMMCAVPIVLITHKMNVRNC